MPGYLPKVEPIMKQGAKGEDAIKLHLKDKNSVND